jgi:hypothetical protein
MSLPEFGCHTFQLYTHNHLLPQRQFGGKYAGFEIPYSLQRRIITDVVIFQFLQNRQNRE